MLIAFFSDIHANLPALEAATADAKKRHVNQIFCAGDITGYGPFPDGVCDFIQASNIKAITGNYDVKVLAAIQDPSSVADLQKKKQKIVLWTAEHLSKRNQKYLAGLPDHLDLEFNGQQKVLVVHGSPSDNDDDIYPSITDRGLKAKIGESGMDILVCGHTHVPFVKRVGGILVVNCGSIGQPVDGDPRLSYTILNFADGKTHARILRLEYNIDRTIEALKSTSLPKVLSKTLTLGSKRMFLQ